MYKIFIVEDDPVICRAVSEHLALWGYQVRSVRDFSRVIEEFTDFNPTWCFWTSACRCITAIITARS